MEDEIEVTMTQLGSFADTTALSLIQNLNESDEHNRCEAKSSQQLGQSVLETICSLSNEPMLGGGFIVLGVARVSASLFPAYEAIGVQDPDQVQSDIASACRSVFNRAIRPQMRTELVNKKNVIVVFVPELGDNEKPLYFVAQGLPRGAFRRIGSTDQHGSHDDLQFYYSQKTTETLDRQAIVDGTLADIDPGALRAYRVIVFLVIPLQQPETRQLPRCCTTWGLPKRRGAA